MEKARLFLVSPFLQKFLQKSIVLSLSLSCNVRKFDKIAGIISLLSFNREYLAENLDENVHNKDIINILYKITKLTLLGRVLQLWLTKLGKQNNSKEGILVKLVTIRATWITGEIIPLSTMSNCEL